MATIFAARSPSLSKWAADVGLGKHVFLISVCAESDNPAELAKQGWCGFQDWAVQAKAPSDLTEEEAIARLQRKEKMIDPALYPKLKGRTGVFRVKFENVENHMMVARALENRDTGDVRPKNADIAKYLIANAQK